jgi:SP family galactose:H+ symporter-like MFS transporter
MNKNRIQVAIIAAIAAVGGLLFGFDTGVISGAQPFLQNKLGWGVTDSMLEIITTSVLVGAIFGCITSGRLSDLFGRKKVIIFISLIFALGTVLSGSAPSVNALMVGRLIIGYAIGVASFVVPLYISEVSPAKIRGGLVTLNQLMITIGIFVSYISDLLLANDNDPFCWRLMFYMGLIPAIILFLGMFFLPESPRWLYSKGRQNEGMKVLNKVEDPLEVKETARLIALEITNEPGKSKIRDILKPWLRIPLMIGMGIFVIQQFVGINTVIYYSPKIFLMSGFNGTKAAITAAVAVGLCNVLFTVLSVFILDKVGRRKLFFIGMWGILLSLLCLGSSFLFQQELGSLLKWFAIISMLLYIAFFAISLGPLGWLLNSEIFPLKVRGFGISLGALSHWFFNAIVAFTFLKVAWLFTSAGNEIPNPDGSLGPNPAGAFLLYAGIAVVGLVWGYFFIPETKGHKLESIEEHWRAGKSPRQL